MIWSNWHGGIPAPISYALTVAEIGSAVFASSGTPEIFRLESPDLIPPPVWWTWPFANLVRNEWCTAVTSGAGASPRSSPRLWEPISPIPRKNWSWEEICAGCSLPLCEPKDTRHDRRHQCQSLALAIPPAGRRRDRGPRDAAAQAECRAGLGRKFRRDSAQGYRRCQRQTGGGLQHPRERLPGAFRVRQSNASRLAGGCAAMRQGLSNAGHKAAPQLSRL